MVLARSCVLSAASHVLAKGLGHQEQTVRQQRRAVLCGVGAWKCFIGCSLFLHESGTPPAVGTVSGRARLVRHAPNVSRLHQAPHV
jgi:hypothetical protein